VQEGVREEERGMRKRVKMKKKNASVILILDSEVDVYVFLTMSIFLPIGLLMVGLNSHLLQ
jgi:hypothetical protein